MLYKTVYRVLHVSTSMVALLGERQSDVSKCVETSNKAGSWATLRHIQIRA